MSSSPIPSPRPRPSSYYGVDSGQLTQQQLLQNATLDNTPRALMQGDVKAKVVKVYDGDTFTAAICVGAVPGTYCTNCDASAEHIQTVPTLFNCRITGIDTPELRTKHLREKECGYIARDVVRHMILGKVVTLKCWGSDKYGRVLTTVFSPKFGDIGLSLIGSELAVEYDGGTKTYDWNTHTFSNGWKKPVVDT